MKEIHSVALDKDYQKLIGMPEKNQKHKDENQIKKDIAKIDAKINRLIDLYQVSDISIETVKQKIHNLNIEKENLKTMLSLPDKNRMEIFEKNMDNFLEISKRKDTDTDEKRLALSTLVERIIINEGDIEILWRI